PSPPGNQGRSDGSVEIRVSQLIMKGTKKFHIAPFIPQSCYVTTAEAVSEKRLPSKFSCHNNRVRLQQRLCKGVVAKALVMLLLVCFHAPLYAFRQSLEGKTSDREIEGFWEGTLVIDNSQLIQVLTLSKGDSGMYSGKLEILHKGTYTIDAVTEAEGTIRLQISQMHAVYEGTSDKGWSKV